MSILMDLLYLALIILVVGLGYIVVMWALKLVGLTVEPRIIQIIFAILVVLVLIWFVGSLGVSSLQMPRLR